MTTLRTRRLILRGVVFPAAPTFAPTFPASGGSRMAAALTNSPVVENNYTSVVNLNSTWKSLQREPL
jgi:hypothetical protein